MRAIILARVSGVEQGKTTSLRAQIKRLREYCSKKELSIIKEYTIIESSTQGKRKQFYDILEGIKRGTEVIALVADAVDRVQRDFKETIILNELIFNRKIELHFIRENIIINYESTPGTHIVWDALVMSAKMFILNLKESSKRGFAYSREKGMYPASAMPSGYISYRDRSGKRIIELDKKKAPKIKKLFEVYAQGSHSTYNLVDIAVNFNLYKKPKDKVERKKIVQNLRRMIKNPFYMGEMVYKNKRFPHIHETLISREIYEKCQKIINKKRKNPKYGMFEHSKTLLHNLGSCGSCGSRLVHAYNRSYPPRPKEYYECCSAKWSLRARCNQHSIRHDTALEETLTALKRLKYSIESRDNLEIQIPILTRGISKNYKVLLADTSDEIKKIENEIKKLIKSYLNRIITLKDYYEIRNELELNKIEQNKKLDYYKKCYKNLSGKFISIIDFASNAASNFQNTENDLEKRKILFMIFEKILLKEGKLEFVYRRPLNILIEEREKRLSWPSIINKIKNQYLEEAISFYTNTDEITNYDIMYKSA